MYRRTIMPIAILGLMLCCVSVKSQSRYKISKLSVNSGASDFSAVYYGNGIVFCSERKNDTVQHFTGSSKNLTDIYYAESLSTGSYGPAQIFSSKILSSYHDGPASFTADQNTMWFSRNLEEFKDPENPDEDLVIGLFSAEKVNGEWTNITAFKYNNKDYSLACPSVTADGKTLYFTSDKPGGHGQSDIYTSRFENGEWTAPENLGPEVNSDQSETFAFIHGSGRLYFASNGHKSMGGLDVFYSDPEGTGWTAPVSLGTPINSKADDFAFIANETNESGYVSSNRKFVDHIYSFEINFPAFKSCMVQASSNTCVTFFEEGTAAMKESPLQYKWNLGDGTEVSGAEAEHCYTEAGDYEVKLSVYDTLTGQQTQDVATFTYSVKAENDIWISAINEDNSTLQFDAKYIEQNLGTPIEFYWDFGDGHRSLGPSILHKYDKAGEYEVLLGMLYKNAKGKTQKICITKAVTAK